MRQYINKKSETVKPQVLVTGANGLLGANVIEQLSHTGYAPIALVREGSNLNALNGLDFKVIYGDVKKRSDVFTAMENCLYVIHCAAQTGPFPNKLSYYQTINIEATKLLVEAARHFKIIRFIFVSTANCFENGSLENPGTEASGFPTWMKNFGYAHSKYLAQQYVLQEVKKNAFPAMVMAPTFLIGPRDAKPSSGKLLLYATRKKLVWCPPGGKSFVDATHAASAIVNALAIGKIGEIYLLSGNNLSYASFFKLVKNGRRQWIIPIPRFVFVGLKNLVGIFDRVSGRNLPLTSAMIRMLYLENYFSNKKAKKYLKMEDTDINASITKFLEWTKHQKY